jgi:hypothetical protein
MELQFVQGDLNASEDRMVWPTTWEPINQGDLSVRVFVPTSEMAPPHCATSLLSFLGPHFCVLASSDDCRSRSGARQT